MRTVLPVRGASVAWPVVQSLSAPYVGVTGVNRASTSASAMRIARPMRYARSSPLAMCRRIVGSESPVLFATVAMV